MNTRETHYWGFRIDTNRPKLFWDELLMGQLRIGWGFDERQNLLEQEKNKKYWGSGAEGAEPNRKIFERVKKGDIILVPRIPVWDEVAVVEATEDFDKGYRFDIHAEAMDYGHIFPAQHLKAFSRSSVLVSGDIRSTLKARCRFWNLDWYREDIEKIIKAPESELKKSASSTDRLKGAINTVFGELSEQLEKGICKKIKHVTSAEEWEYALVEVLQELFPQYDVERVGGKSEVHHGTDILIKITVPFEEYQYGIAIQVKDYKGQVGKDVIDQINKADGFWSEQGVKIIEKVVIVTESIRKDNLHLSKDKSGVRFIFSDELNPLLFQYAKKIIGDKND